MIAMHRSGIRNTLFVLALFSTSVHVSAQAKPEDKVKIKAKMGLDQKPDGTMMPYSIVRSSNTAFIVLRSPDFDRKPFTKQSPRLDVYDREKVTYLRSLEPVMQRLGKEKLLLEDLTHFGGKPMLVARTGGGEEVALYYQNVEPHLTKQSPNFERFCAFPVEVKERHAVYEQEGNPTREKWSTVIAGDSAHMLVHSTELRGGDDDDAFYLLAMVDRQMQVTWQHILRVDNGSERSEVLDAAVDSAGTAYVLVKYRFADGAPGEGASDYQVVLHRIDGEDIGRVSLGLDGGYYPTGGILEPMGKGRIAYAGIYATGGKKLGNFLAFADTSEGGLSMPTLMPFADGVDLEAEEVSGVEEDAKKEDAKADKKENKKLISTTDVIALLPRSDGGFYLVNEVEFSASYIDPESARRYQRFYRGPLQARSFTKDGQEKWTTLFRRWNTGNDPILGRAFPAVFNDQLYIFMWDTDDTAEKRKIGAPIEPKQTSGTYSIYASFDDKGAYRTKPILRNDNDSDLIAGWKLVRIGKDEYVTMGTGSLTTVEYLPVKIDFIKEVKK